jgi:hypothetical protein
VLVVVARASDVEVVVEVDVVVVVMMHGASSGSRQLSRAVQQSRYF